MSFEGLPLECQRNVLERLHWRDVCAVSSCSRALRAVASDEHDWRGRCARRFTSAELERLASAASGSTSDDGTWRGLFKRAVARARDGARAAGPLLAVPDNQRVHFRQFERALEHLRGMSLACFEEFIGGEKNATTRQHNAVLLALAGLTECLARAPDFPARADEALEVLSRCGALGEKRVRLQMWALGRLDGSAPFRLRDETVVHEGTLRELVATGGASNVWNIMARGIKHEVRDMEVESVGPKPKSFWENL